MFESDRIDIIVYGHPRRSQNKVIEDILFFNRGKATNPFGILTINGGSQGQVISFR
jgi:predicted phosphodiesterase